MRAFVRLLIMGLVMAAVLTASVVAGIATTAALMLGLLAAGIVGLFGLARHQRDMLAAASGAQAEAAGAPTPAGSQGGPRLAAPPAGRAETSAVRAPTPDPVEDEDPEASMPRWRRPSLLEARHADPSHSGFAAHTPRRFAATVPVDGNLRVVRYAVVPVLDQPDEILGRRLSDLAAGDEVQVLETSGSFMLVVCPDGAQGWVHRTTLRQPPAIGPARGARELSPDADDALSALLAARGLR
jgi:hypothetical protein